MKSKQVAAAWVSLYCLSFADGAVMAQPAASAETARPRTVVSYADLDIRSTAGLASLNSRVRRAAAQVCRPRGEQALWQRWGRADCYRKTLARAEVQVAQRLANEGSLPGRWIQIVAQEQRSRTRAATDRR